MWDCETGCLTLSSSLKVQAFLLGKYHQIIFVAKCGRLTTVTPLSTAMGLGVADRFWLFIFTLNRAKNWFNSKLNREYSFNKIIHSKLDQKYSFKLENKSQLEKTVKNRQKGPVLSKKRRFYSFFLWIAHFFDSFNNWFNCTAKIFIQKIYSFKRESEIFIQRIHSFKK